VKSLSRYIKQKKIHIQEKFRRLRKGEDLEAKTSRTGERKITIAEISRIKKEYWWKPLFDDGAHAEGVSLGKKREQAVANWGMGGGGEFRELFRELN